MKKIAYVLFLALSSLSLNVMATNLPESLKYLYQDPHDGQIDGNVVLNYPVIVPNEQRLEQNEKMRTFGMYMIKHAKELYENKEKNADFYQKAQEKGLATDEESVKKGFSDFSMIPVYSLYQLPKQDDASIEIIKNNYQEYFDMICGKDLSDCKSYNINDLLPDDKNPVTVEKITYIVVHQADQLEVENRKASLLYYKAEGMNDTFYGAVLTYLSLNDLEKGKGFVFETNNKDISILKMADNIKSSLSPEDAAKIIMATKRLVTRAYYINASEKTVEDILWDSRQIK